AMNDRIVAAVAVEVRPARMEEVVPDILRHNSPAACILPVKRQRLVAVRSADATLRDGSKAGALGERGNAAFIGELVAADDRTEMLDVDAIQSAVMGARIAIAIQRAVTRRRTILVDQVYNRAVAGVGHRLGQQSRSEERRVGKEGGAHK